MTGAIASRLSVALLAMVAAAWAWSYIDHAYLDRGRLLLIVGKSDDVEMMVFLADGGAHGTADARAVLVRPVAWDDLADEAMAGRYRGRFVNLGHAYGWGVVDAGATPSGLPTAAPGRRVWIVAVPIWATGVPPAVWLTACAASRRRRRSRLTAGRCIQCGYDLRGSSGRCPECGTASPV